jgi:transcriptional regulator with XRE-family HTH domain
MWTNSYSLEQLGEFLQDVRKSQGITQLDFAKTIGVSHATLSNLEQGKNTSTETLQKALQYLGLRIVVAPKTADVTVNETIKAEGRE